MLSSREGIKNYIGQAFNYIETVFRTNYFIEFFRNKVFTFSCANRYLQNAFVNQQQFSSSERLACMSFIKEIKCHNHIHIQRTHVGGNSHKFEFQKLLRFCNRSSLSLFVACKFHCKCAYTRSNTETQFEMKYTRAKSR